MHVISWMAGNGHTACFAGVLVLTMASLRLNVFPSVRLNRLNEISDLHLTSILQYMHIAQLVQPSWQPSWCQPSSSPVGAGHDQGNGQATISKSKRGLGGWEAVESGAEMSYGVTERYGADFSGLRGKGS